MDHKLVVPPSCPWDFECVIMYTWHECHFLIGTGTEAGLLVELLTSQTVLLQCGPDSLSDVQGLGSRIIMHLEKAALYFCCHGCGVLLSTEGVLRISIDCYDTAWSRHLEL